MDSISLDGKLVCVVDDDDIYRQYIVALLSEQKVQTIAVSDGDQLIDLLGRRSVDCILLDYGLASESGLTLHEQLRDRFNSIPPVIMLTAEDNQRTIIKAFRTGISDYVLKRGLRSDELISAIRSSVGRRQEAKHAEENISRLKRHSMLDEVTGLYRREAIEERLGRAADRATRQHGQFAVIAVAFNEFEEIEKRFGQAVADKALRAFALGLQKAMRPSDICSRFGVDVFLCLVDTDIDQQKVEGIAVDLDRALAFQITLDAISFRVSASVGTAMFPHDGDDPSTVVAAAAHAAATTRARHTAMTLSAPDAAQADHPGATPMVSERRKARRQRVFKAGKIVLNDLHSVVDCTVRDLTDAGARLLLSSQFAAPPEFGLVLSGASGLRRVRLRWQRGNTLGVNFID
jgi:diguanylate cyclase (GGDEF)-like protein